MKFFIKFITLFLILLLFSNCNMGVIGSFDFDEAIINDDLSLVIGKINLKNSCELSGDCSVVNGLISLGDNNELDGEISVINGNITINENNEVRSINSVNGNITIGNNSVIRDDINNVNGNIKCQQAKVLGSINSVNGNIQLNKSQLTKNLNLVNGIINLDDTIIEKDIVVKKSNDKEKNKIQVKIYIRGGSMIQGNIEAEEPGIVEVHLIDGKIVGEMKNIVTVN